MHQRLNPRQPLPQFPPRMQVRKVLFLKPAPLHSKSPPAHLLKPAWFVVEAVGASPKAQASCAIEQSNATSAAAAKVDMDEGAPPLSRDWARQGGYFDCRLFAAAAPLFAVFEGWEPPQISSPVIAISGTRNLLIVASSAKNLLRLARSQTTPAPHPPGPPFRSRAAPPPDADTTTESPSNSKSPQSSANQPALPHSGHLLRAPRTHTANPPAR